MSNAAKPAATARRSRTAAAVSRVAIPAAFAVAAIAMVSGCSSLSPAASSASPAPAAAAASASPASTPSGPATPPSPAATPVATPVATSAPAAPPAPAQGSLTAKVTILNPSEGLVPGGSAVRFTVSVTNGSSQTYQNILPLVSLGHCSCTASSLFPAGTLQERESTSNMWQTIPYDVEGFGTDYLNVTEPGGIQLISPGATATFEYRVKLSPASSAQVIRGTGSFDVTLIQLPGHAQIGVSPAGSAAIDVQSGQPPD
jgi:hypothetical protein